MLRLERERLLALLASLDDVDWVRPTPCPAWDVAGLCRHLLGDDLYVLSLVRDGHRGTNPPPELDEAGFIAWIDRLQADWVDASRRVSPRLVVELLGWLGPHVASAFEQLDLRAVEADVSWASDRPVPQWLEAWAYPYRLASIDASSGSTVRIDVTGAVERRWWIARGDRWEFAEEAAGDVVAAARLDADEAWRLLTNNLPPDAALDITGAPAIVDVLRRTRASIGSPD